MVARVVLQKGRAVTHNRYKCVTVSLSKRLRAGRFTSETAVRWFQKSETDTSKQ
jgi:hypothetical protein